MKYEGNIYRPPSEAYSVIIQVSIGCSHNQCTFCGMYKDKAFRMRGLEEIFKDLSLARETYREVKKIFLADGNALTMPKGHLERILLEIKRLFPECERVSAYSAPRDILGKSLEELKEIKDLGLQLLYLGVESGSDRILEKINKGVRKKEMIAAGKKAVSAGFKLSVTVISGLGGRELWQEHAVETAEVINGIQPHYFGLLTLLIQEGTPLYDAVEKGEFQLQGPKEVLEETRRMIEHLELNNTVFRSNHASNYLALKGNLSRDKEALLENIDEALNDQGEYLQRELYRRL